MNCIEIDLETRSDRDITKCGVYAYADSPYFAITLMSISVDGGEVQQYDFTAGDTVPEDILRALVDETVIKRAHNVNFERICLSKYLRDNYPHIFRSYSIPEDTVGDYLSPRGWHCTMIHCRTLALPSLLTVFRSFTLLPMHRKNGRFSRHTTGRMWSQNLPLMNDSHVILFLLLSGKSSIWIRR